MKKILFVLILIICQQIGYSKTFTSGGINFATTGLYDANGLPTVGVIAGGYKGAIVVKSTVTFQGVTYAVTSVNSSAFAGCTTMTKITLPNSIVAIQEHAFDGCTGISSLPSLSSVVSIGDYAFFNCKNIKTLVLSSVIKSVGSFAFAGCSFTSAISIPANIGSIGAAAFAGGKGEVVVANDNVKYSSLKGALYDDSYKVLIQCPISYTGVFNVEPTVLEINSYAFYNCNLVTEVKMTESVKVLKDYAFGGGLAGIKNIQLSSSLTQIGKFAFSDCNGISSLTLPASVTQIGSYSFSACQNLQTITFLSPSSINVIAEDAFRQCTGLQFIEIPESVDTISASSFADCPNLKSIKLPASVKSIGSLAFASDSALIRLDLASGSVLSSVGDQSFFNCKSLSEIVLPSSVDSIGNSAFSGCLSLSRIDLPASVRHIGSMAFINCKNLKTIQLPSNITEVTDGLFTNCSSLSSIYLPNSVTVVGNCAFSGCTELKSVSWSPSVLTIGNRVFSDCNKLTIVTIPRSTNYLGKWVFEGFKGEIKVDPLNEFFYSEKGLLYSKDKSTLIKCSAINAGLVQILPQVRRILTSSFADCGSITQVTIPSSVNYIGNDAFRNCVLIEKVELPSSLKFIGDNIFSGCAKLGGQFTLSDSVSCIGVSSFQGCRSITSLSIPSSVLTIGSYAFYDCSGLESIYCYRNYPDSIDSNVFFNVNKGSCKLYVPAGSKNLYQSAKGWSEFTIIEELSAVDKIKKGINLYYDKLSGTLQTEGKGGSSSVYLYDIHGRLVETRTVAIGDSYSTKNLQKGIYIVKLSCEGEVVSKKFAVQ